MSIPVVIMRQLQELAVGQANIEGDLKVLMAKYENLRQDVDIKHNTNISSIDELKTGLKAAVHSVTQIRTKLAVWAAMGGLISGVIVAVCIEVLRVVAERYFK